MKIGLILLLTARLAHGYTVMGGESDVSSSLWWCIPAAGCVGSTASSNWDLQSGGDVPTAICAMSATPGNTSKTVLAFNDGTGASIVKPSAQQTMLLPQAPTPATAAYVTNGTLGVTLMWYAVATTNSVRWCAAIVCRAEGETDDVAFDTEGCVNDAAKGTTLQLNTTYIPLGGTSSDTCGANELLHLKLSRDSDNAADTMSGDAFLVSVTVAWPRFQ